MDCAEEFRVIAKAVSSLPGVDNARADYLTRVLTVDLDETQTTKHLVHDRLRGIGFPAVDRVQSAQDTNAVARRRKLATATGGALFLFSGIFWLANRNDVAYSLAVTSTIISGWHVGASALRALRFGRLEMNSLMVIAAGGALLLGEYFEAAVAMFLFGVSIWIESYSVERAKKAVASLVNLMPLRARRVKYDSLETRSFGAELGQRSAQAIGLGSLSADDFVEVSAQDVHRRDIISVRPGERIPADGIILDGESLVNQASITGESRSILRTKGDGVFAGSLNGNSPLLIEATSCAHDCTLASVARLVDEARNSTSPTERFVDQFARYYTPAVIALAFLISIVIPIGMSLIANQQLGMHLGAWFHRGLVMLVIACPCALVISTPITIVCGLHRATRSGILVKGGDYLELAGKVDTIVVDKTGTVTEGKPIVRSYHVADGVAKQLFLETSAALEVHSEHPLGKSIVAVAKDHGIEVASADNIQTVTGAGVSGTIKGIDVAIGNAALFQHLQWPVSRSLNTFLESVGSCGSEDLSGSDNGAWVFVARRTAVLGCFLLWDAPREHASDAIEDWKHLGITTIALLSGDDRTVVSEIANQVGIDQAIGEMLPADKFERIRELHASGNSVLMVGDGVNDSPALAAAKVGVAIGNESSDLALDSADVVLLAPNLMKVGELIRLSRKTKSILWQNIGFAITTKALVLCLAGFGFATMWMAVAADVGASLLVISNGMRILRH